MANKVNKDIDIRSFKRGMNKDLDYSLLPQDAYVDAQNFKLIVDEESNGFILENAQGNKKVIDLSDLSEIGVSYRIVGQTYVKPYLVVFMSEIGYDTTPDGSSGLKNSAIVKLTIHNEEVHDAEVIYKDNSTLGWLNLSRNYPIKAKGVIESDDIVHVYWADKYNEDRFCNILDPNLATQSVDKFSMVADFPLLSGSNDTRAEFVELVGGNLKASKVEYTYQYYNLNGSATKFAPVSPGIVIPNGNSINSKSYKGLDQGEYSGVGCKIKINMPTVKTFDRIRLVALDYETINSVPSVRVFGEYEISSSDTSTAQYYKDVGNTINEIVYEDFLTYGQTTYKSGDLEIKDNILFKSDIEEEVFDVDFDARAYRFNSSGISFLYQSDYLSYYRLDGSDGSWTYGSTSGTAWSIPETADCINRYNDPEWENDSSFQLLYKTDGVTFGAEGKNVSVEFDIDLLNSIDTVGIGSGGNYYYDSSSASTNPANPYNVAYQSSFQRQEVYRIGVVFFNKKMQSSKVKWICDMKMPNHADYSSEYKFTYQSGSDTIARLLGLKVTLSNMPSEAYAWQVVMVKRDSNDRSVLANGVMQTPVKDGTDYWPGPGTQLTTEADTANTSTRMPNLMMFISPEINFNKNLSFRSGDWLQYVGYFTYSTSSNSTTFLTQAYNNKLNKFNQLGDYTSSYKSVLTDAKIVEQTANEDARTNVGSISFNNYAGGDATYGAGNNGLHGTMLVCYSDDPLTPSSDSSRIPLVSYKRDVFASQYGGNTYYDRQRNEYMGISELRYSNTYVVTHEGDTNIDYFWYLKQSIDLEDTGDSSFSTLLFPVESSIVLSLRHDDVYFRQDLNNSILMREIAGTYDEEIDGDDLYYIQVSDLYQYNTVYSNRDRAQKYLVKLIDSSEQTYFPTRVRYSDTKIYGEQYDSFTIFRANNFIDLVTKYGSVNNLVNFKNNLFFWQDTAFGILSVNTRSLIQDNNPGILSLGSGGILDRYDYISTQSGNVNPYGVIASNYYLYWVDNFRNEIMRYGGKGDNSLSKAQGIQSWMNKKGRVGWVKGVYDKKYNDVIFTLHFSRYGYTQSASGEYLQSLINLSDDTGMSTTSTNGVILHGVPETRYGNNSNLTYLTGVPAGDGWYTDSGVKTDTLNIYGDSGTSSKIYFTLKEDNSNGDVYTLSYNEAIGSFVSFHSFTPDWYIELDGGYFTSNNGYMLYKHNDEDANRCEYYGVQYDSSVTTVFNKNFPYTKVFDVIKWHSESESSDVNMFKDTFDQVEVWNDYQHSGTRDLYYKGDSSAGLTRAWPITRRERTWSMQVPRDIVSAAEDTNPDIFDSSNWDETNGRNSRIRDKYMAAKFIYENDNNNRTFSIPFISSVYRISYR